MPYCRHDLSSLTRNWTHAFYSGSAEVLTTGPPGKFLDQELNPCPLQWKCRILTTGLPEKSPDIFLFGNCTWTNSFNHDNNFEVGTTVLCILEMRTLKNNKVINSVLQGHTESKGETKFWFQTVKLQGLYSFPLCNIASLPDRKRGMLSS